MPAAAQQSAHQTLTARLRAAGCVFAEDEARLLIDAAQTPEALEAMARSRISGLPLEHILGWAEFCGLRIAVTSGVFVPRRRTEFLVRQAAAVLDAWRMAILHQDNGHTGSPRPHGQGGDPAADTTPVVVDLCCGSGAVGAALAALSGPVELHAADIDPLAAACARRNVEPLGGAVHEGDLYTPLPGRLRGRVRVLAVNAPYVPSADIGTMPPEARLHEPRACLDGGADGLEVQRRVAAGALQWLAPGGELLIETSRRQASRTAGILRSHGLAVRILKSEELGATVVAGTRAFSG
ncbi:methyltransferase [Arthrobacter sp. PM3]|uniref:methyltransferase n=1 Tax=Arthrobacter sp. PM3 TaxID=2017685 RepID=UPI001ABFF0A4|nr:methyltransferase [Arthrobacter sp. PM3]